MKRAALLLALISFATFAADTDQLPELKTKVEPNWGKLTSGYVVDVAEVELRMHPSGEPFSVASIVSLPDPVVQALAGWRFSRYRKNGKDVPFTMLVNIPIRRAADADYEQFESVDFRNDGAAFRAMTSALPLDPAQAESALKGLPQTENASEARATLLAYYADKGSLADPDGARRIRAELISWFIANDAENTVLDSPLAMINPSSDHGEVSTLTEAWLRVLKEHPGNRRLTNSAIHFLRLANPAVALQVINALPPSSRRSNWLGHVRLLSGIGVTVLSPSKGAFTATASAELPNTEFAIACRHALLVSADAAEVISAMHTSKQVARDLVDSQGTLPQGYGEFCDALLKRARELFPQAHGDCQRPQPLTQSVFTKGRLTNKLQPLYPAQAREHGLQGTVTFQAVIGRDGTAHNLELMSGDLAFYEASRRAALQWRWQPNLLNGVPVDVNTEIEIRFLRGSLIEIYENDSPPSP